MDNQHKKNYEAPALTVVTFKTERGYATSSFPNSLRLRDAWIVSATNAWSGGGSGSNSLGGGWTDNGGSAWE